MSLADVSLVCANFGNADTFANVLADWIAFLGGRPGEIVIVDGGSDERTQAVYWDLYRAGKIDKLQLIRPDHPENHKDLCYIQEHTVAAIASRKYLCFFKSDTLPYRNGHDDWVAQAITHLDRPDVFAIGGSFNVPSKHHDAWPGWYFSHKCSENFAFMKRTSFMAAMEEFAGQYIASGFAGTNPALSTGQHRYLVEVAFERYIERHQRFTLVRQEDPTWTVFHTNSAGPRLAEVRRDYLARIDIEPHLNAASVVPMHGGDYYGKPRNRLKELRVALGATLIGPWWRAMKRAVGA